MRYLSFFFLLHLLLYHFPFRPCLYGHDRTGTTQFVFVFYFDDRFLHLSGQLISHASGVETLLTSTPSSKRSHQGEIQLEALLRGKGLVGI